MVELKQIVGLRARVLRAGFWTVSGYAVETIVSLASSLIMTRLLVPEAFGLMAVAMTIPVGLTMLSDVGIQSNVIRKSGSLETTFIRTAWTIQVIRGALLWGATLLLAALLSAPTVQLMIPADSLWADPQLPSVLAAIGSILAISGLNSVNLYVQERNIHLGPVAVRTIASKIVTLPIMLVWVIFDRSVWALVAGTVASQSVLALLSHYLVPGERMKFAWDVHHRKELLGESKWVVLSSTNGFIANSGDRLILATILTTKQMGYYAIAYMITGVIRTLLQKLHGQITLSVLSELFRTRPAAAKDAYYRYRRFIDIPTFLAAGFLLVTGPDVIKLLYDDRYAQVGWILQLLALSLIPFPFQMINSAFIVNYEWRSYSLNVAAFAVSMFLATVAGYYFAGWIGAIWGLALHGWPATILLLVKAHKRGWISPIREIVMLPFALLGVALGFFSQWLLHMFGVMH